MKLLKKMHLFIFGFMLVFAGIFFVSCGDVDYSNVTLICEETNVTLDIEQELEINFTIQNYIGGTSGELNIHNDDPTVVSYEKSLPNGGVTTLRLKGLKGGTAHIRAVTVDGNKDCTITVTVRQYADTITKKDKNLYIWIMVAVKNRYKNNKLSLSEIQIIEKLVGKSLDDLYCGKNEPIKVKVIDIVEKKEVGIFKSLKETARRMKERYDIKISYSNFPRQKWDSHLEKSIL